MSDLNLYAPTNGAWVDPATGRLTANAQIWLRDLWNRVGGYRALSPKELEALIEIAQAAAEAAQAAADAAQADVDALELVVGVLQGDLTALTALVSLLQADLDALEATVAAIVHGHAIQDDGVALAQRSILDFVGDGVTVTDTGTKTQVSIPGPVTVKVQLSGDVSTAADTVAVDLLSFTVEPYSTYVFRWQGNISPAAATTGVGFQVTL
jgi:hypothetical protein